MSGAGMHHPHPPHHHHHPHPHSHSQAAAAAAHYQHWIAAAAAAAPAPVTPAAAAGAAAPPAMHGDSPYSAHSSSFEEDVKERELQNLLRWWPGYEASQINVKGDQAMGFALFSTAQLAMQARDALQNLVFDAETNSVLRAEMAKKNLYVKRVSDTNTLDQSKRMRTVGDYTPAAYPAPATFVSPGPSVWGPQSYLAAPHAPFDPYGGYPVPHVASVPLAIAPAGYAPVQNMKDNPPCNTLFIGNLGENTSEAELRGLFSRQSGFRQMKVLRQGRSTVCFIEFEDVNSAMAVHNNLQGAILGSSDRGGMRIQYSKNPYGRKKDANGGHQPRANNSSAALGPSQQNLNSTQSSSP